MSMVFLIFPKNKQSLILLFCWVSSSFYPFPARPPLTSRAPTSYLDSHSEEIEFSFTSTFFILLSVSLCISLSLCLFLS